MNFLDFLNRSVTPYHAVENVLQEFLHHGFIQLHEEKPWPLEAGGAYVIQRAGALLAFRTPQIADSHSRFQIGVAHTDFPTLKLTSNPEKRFAEINVLHPEIYGSPLLHTWFDRDLGIAGLLRYEFDGDIYTKLVQLPEKFRIPSLAVHLNRNLNQEGFKPDLQKHLDICFSANSTFQERIQRELKDKETLLGFDLQFFDTAKAEIGGANGEWIYSGRLDNLSSCHALMQGLLTSSSIKHWNVICLFNHEEIGSKTREGACSNFLKSNLKRAYTLLAKDVSLFEGVLSQSLLLSVDAAHARHPAFIEKSEPNHAPLLGKGIVLKQNAMQRYATDVYSVSVLKKILQGSDIPLQYFVSRNDIPCGSTVGPALSASLGSLAVDIGEGLLSMHSIREMISVEDHEYLIQLLKRVFSQN